MILCVDADDAARRKTNETLATAGFDPVSGESLSDALDVLDEEGSIECLVTEYDLPDGTGLELMRAVRAAAPDATCILFTDVPLERIDTSDVGEIVAEYQGKGDPEARERLVELVRHSLAFRSQTAYPVPDDEDARIAALERYASDPAALGSSLDRLTELAKELYDVNSAAVGIIGDHHERFLSCYGTTFDPLDRQDTICTYTILEEGVTVVEDVAEDPRFTDFDHLADAGIEFYAGAPIVTPEGHAIGVFCLHDDEPRTLTERDRELLALLAEEAMDQLVLRRRIRAAHGEIDDER